MPRRILILIAAAGLAVAGAVAGAVALEETGRWGDPATEPALIGRAEELLGIRAEGVLERAFPGLALPGEAEGPTPISPDAPTAVSRPRVTRDAPSSFDGDLRDLPPPAPAAGLAPLREELVPPRRPTVDAPVADGALQRFAPRAPAPAATVTDGISRVASGSLAVPPDTSIDVGTNHVIEAVNTNWAIYGKSEPRGQVASGSFDGLIDGTGTACDDHNQGDPIVVYDTIADRWILSDFAWIDDATGPLYECFAVSKTANPVTGGWWFYAFETGQSPSGVTPATRNYFPDFPKLGVWPDGLYMTLNMFDGNGAWSNGRVMAFDRTKMEAGLASTAIAFDLPSSASSLLPANARVNTGLPADGTPNYIAQIRTTGSLRVWKFHVDWTTPENSWISNAGSDSPTDVAVTAFSWGPSRAPTPAPGNSIDTVRDRLMMQNQYSSIDGAESLWLTHAVGTGAPSVAAVRWYQLAVTGDTIASTPVQQATWAPGDGLYRFMSSIAVNRLGDVALGYSASNSATHAGIRYAGRLAGDPASTFTLGEQTMQAGTGSQQGASRWGDYSAMTLDPVDGCTFWYANEYYVANGTDWHTAIGSFGYPGCTTPPANTSAPVASVTGTALVGSTLSATKGSWSGVPTTYTYQWQRLTGAVWADIATAQSSSYTLVDADGGASVRCRVTATSPYGNTTASSNTIAVPVKLTLVTAIAAPATAKVGTPVSATPATWSATPTPPVQYQWQRDGVDIALATTATYTPMYLDAGAILTVEETANTGYTSTSAGTQVAPFRNTSPTIAQSDTTLTRTSNGSWFGAAGATIVYRWQRDNGGSWADIGGATGSTYTLTDADADGRVRAVATATLGGASDTNASDPIDAPVRVAATSPPVPAVATARVGDLILISLGSWTPEPDTRTFQWLRDGVPIDGAVNSLYTVTIDDVGTTLRVRETANLLYASTSSAIQVAPAETPVPTPAPTPGPAAGPAAAPAVAGAGAGGALAPSGATRIGNVSAPPVSRTALASGLPVAFSAGEAATVTIVVRARGKIIGSITKAVPAGAQRLTVPIRKAARARLAKGTVLSIAISGKTKSGTTLRPVATSTVLR